MKSKLFECFETGDHPGRVIMTDDPLRAKMLAAHHLENAVPILEQGGLMVYFGSYKQISIALVSTGFDPGITLEYIHGAKKAGVTEILYIGECVSASRCLALRTVILADCGHAGLRERARSAASQYSIPVTIRPVLLRANTAPGFDGAADGITEEIYAHAGENGVAALSVLTVSENIATDEKMEEHERRSRLYSAARLVFETAALA